jgi:hypothetical protein
MSAEFSRQRSLLLAATILALLALLGLPPLLDFSVDPDLFWSTIKVAAVLACIAPIAAWRGMRSIQAALEATSIGILLVLPVLVITFAAMRLNMPLADDGLIAADRWLGFDWPSFVRLVDGYPMAAWLLALGYASFSFQLLFVPALLCVFGMPARAYQFVLGYFVLCVLASIISIWFPSVGAYQAFGVEPGSMRHIDARYGHLFLDAFHGVRNEAHFYLTIGKTYGILTFPSVHVGVAVLCTWAAWPSRILRYPFLAVNILMAIGAITHGAHYLVDIIAGAAVAFVTVIAISQARLPRLQLIRPRAAPAAAIGK